MFKKGSSTQKEFHKGLHRKEHWYRDNTVYFITTRCTDQYAAFTSAEAKAIFWRQIEKYSAEHHFDVWICTLMNNHYHAIGYLSRAMDLAPMIRKFHGSVAKLVNDVLPQRIVPFWEDYFDGCLRDENQYCRAYRYTLLQAVRAGICGDYRDYPDTHVRVGLRDGLGMAVQRRVFLANVPYKRYEKTGDLPTKVGRPGSAKT